MDLVPNDPVLFSKDLHEQKLYWATANNNFVAVKEACDDRARLDYKSYFTGYNTALFCACQQGYYLIAALLIEKGACVECINKDHKTPLLIATIKGHLPIIKLLIDNGARLFLPGTHPTTPLLEAATYGHLSLVRDFLSRHPEALNQTNREGLTPLMCAAQTGKVSVVAYLLSLRSIDVEAVNKNNQTAAELAAEQYHKLSTDQTTQIDTYRLIGLMILNHLRIYSSHGGIAKNGLCQTNLPPEILYAIARFTSISQNP